ncbi:MAG: GNAT family N-acetyltransferase [Nocardioidaceae bacterium]
MSSPRSLKVRAFDEADRDAVVALAPRLSIGVAHWRDPKAVVAAALEWVAESMARAASEDGALFVGEREGQVVGFVSVSTRPHFTGELDAYIGELVVDARAERTGVGAALVGQACQWAAEAGLRRISLETGAANDGARLFYSRLGFDEEDVRLSGALSAPRQHAPVPPARQVLE